LVVSTVGGLIGLALWLLFANQSFDHERVYKIEYGLDIPFHFRDTNGLPSGLAVQIVQEAARREKIKLEWVDPSVQDTRGSDLWVLMTILPERAKRFHFTAPYLQTESYFVVLANSPFQKPSDLATARISYLDFGIHRKNLSLLVPDMRPVPVQSSREALAKLAAGESDAAYIDQYAAMPALLAGEAHAPMRLIPSRAPVGKLGLASTFARAPVADALRDAMAVMADDGTISSIVAHWGVFPNLTTDMIGGLVTAQRRAHWLTAGIVTLSALLLVAGWLAARSWKQTGELRHASRALRQSEAKSRAIVQAIPDLMFRLSREGEHLDFHASHALPFPLEGKAFLGKKASDIYPAEVAGMYLGHIDLALARKGVQRFEYALDVPPTGKRYFEARLVACGSDEVLAIVRDITERQRSEEMRTRLETQIQETRRIESIGLLAGGVAHDFNNILASITMRLDMLRFQATCDPETEETLKELTVETQRAAALTQQLLQFSRQSTVELQELDLNELVNHLFRRLVRLVSEDITVRFAPKDQPVLVKGDAGLFEQILFNLVLNARDAMPDGGNLSLSIDHVDVDPDRSLTLPETAARSFVRLMVADEGCGMDESVRMRIFEPFYTTKEPGKGTGLGLATVYGCVVQLQGWIEVQSAPGKGAIFNVYLPAAREK
jgi:signal transduction histidine kinase